MMHALLIFLCLVLFPCHTKAGEGFLVNNGEVRAFLNHFFAPGSSLQKEKTEALLFGDGIGFVSTGVEMCTSDSPCNRTKEYFLEFTPNFLFETRNGRKIVWADPDAFVDLCDIRKLKCYRLRSTGTDGSIYGTCWVTDFAFVVYGIEYDAGFVEVFDIKARTKTSYTIDKARRKADADRDAFLIVRYGEVAAFQAP